MKKKVKCKRCKGKGYYKKYYEKPDPDPPEWVEALGDFVRVVIEICTS